MMDRDAAVKRALQWLMADCPVSNERRVNNYANIYTAMEKLWEKAEIHGERNMDRQYTVLAGAKSMSQFKRLVTQLPGPMGKGAECGHGTVEYVKVYHSGEGDCAACVMEE